MDDGSPDVADTLTVIPGLWIHDAENGALSAKNYQWQWDGSDISGATNDSYTLTSGDEGSAIQVTEALGDSGGLRFASSLPIAVAGTTTWSVPAPVANAGSISLTTGSNQPSPPAAPIIGTTGDSTVTLNAA